MHFDAQIEISSEVCWLPTLRHLVGDLTAELGWNESESRGITLAVEEALTNKIRHAYGTRAEGRIQFGCRIEEGALVIRLMDQGEAPDPDNICARARESMHAGGFGTHIIRDVMDTVLYQTTAEGNELILTKALPEHAR